MIHKGEEAVKLTRLVAVVTVCLSLTLRHVESFAVSWNYKPHDIKGPENWHIDYPDCGGRMQSPIDINTSQVLYDPNLELFDLSEYSITENVTMELANVGGHTVEVIMGGADICQKMGGQPDKYKLAQYHFHWGVDDRRGSEHGFNGYHYPMELHLVHYQYSLQNMTVASSHPFGLAVLGFFIEIGEHNPAFDHLLTYFSNITNATYPDANVTIPTFSVASLLPKTSRLDYFRYFGSLTTPPCYESVIWSIATETIKISEEQINYFRRLYDAERDPLVNDYRPIQPLDERSLLTTHLMYKPSESDNDGSNALTPPQITTIVLAFLFAAMYLF